MSDHPFKCPHCTEQYPLHVYNLGMSDIIEMRCTRCPVVIGVGLYSAHFDASVSPLIRFLRKTPRLFTYMLRSRIPLKTYTKGFFRRLSNRVSPCSCGGVLDPFAPHRCPKCLAPLPMDEIKRQINWQGGPEGTPGVYTTDFREV
jgi:hypothetical protein